MKRLLAPALFAAVSLILVMVLRASLPKYAGMLLYFLVFLLLDWYLWRSVRNMTRRKGGAVRFATTIIYWLPFALIIAMTLVGSFFPFTGWNIPLRTYLLSFLLIIVIAKLLPVFTLLLSDLARLVQYLISLPGKQRRPWRSIPRYVPLQAAGWIAGAALFLILTAGTLFWQYDFRVRTRTISMKNLPASFEGFRIVQFSDVHLGSWNSKKKLKEAMELINGLQPDVIFFTGDMFNFSTVEEEGFENILGLLHAPCGIYAVMGNHDYGDYRTWPSPEAKARNLQDLISFYRSLGWKLLRNEHDVIRKGGDSIAVLGAENWGATRRFQRYGDAGKAEQGTETMAVRLLLSHDPSYWEHIVSKKFPEIDLTFAGHTHGGQIGIDCGGFAWSPVIWTSNLWSGLYVEAHPGHVQYLYVNRGLGNIGYAGRVGILPEITLFILSKEHPSSPPAH